MSENKDRIMQQLDLPAEIKSLDFFLETNQDGFLRANDFVLAGVDKTDEGLAFKLSNEDYVVIWQFRNFAASYAVSLQVQRLGGCDLKNICPLILNCQTSTPVTELWANKIPSFLEIGFDRLDPDNKLKNRFEHICALFPAPDKAGVFVGTLSGQKHIHETYVEVVGKKELAIESISRIISGLAKQEELSSENVWFSLGSDYFNSLDRYTGHSIKPSKTKGPVLGFNTWDYYYNALRSEDVLENADSILADPVLNRHLQYIIIDAGWQHVHGEWYANHRFKEGMAWMADQITARGFTPGIWVAPLVVDSLSWPGLRNPELLIKDEYGDPLMTEYGYTVDPTAPAGEEYILALFKRLYNYGFRLFKIDYLNGIDQASYFYDKAAGPYDAYRKLFQTIRAATGPDTYLLGCSWPEAAGPGYADSTRITVDIHNQWIQLLWVVDHIQNSYFVPEHIIDYDFDFLVVRGQDTSLEEETNVLNPEANNPNPQGFATRWRRGPVFNYEEAKTWAGFVLVSGGNTVLSDRLSMLNEKGKDLVRRVFAGHKKTSFLRPLDLFTKKYASFWLQKCQDGTRRLLLVNFSEQTKEFEFNFTDYDITAPGSVRDFWTSNQVNVEGKKIQLSLPAHGSAVYEWHEEN